MVVKPLGLPVGSVRALLLGCLAARAILDLRSRGDLAPWLMVALAIAAAAYFSARSVASAHRGMAPGGEDAPRSRPPLGLPAGSIRLLFLVAAGYGAWLWFDGHESGAADPSVLWVLGAFVVGVFMRWVLTRLRPEDAGARAADHLLALVSLLCGGGLVAIAATGHGNEVADWTQPLLAAVCVHYFATR
jgi:hypothetical protein